MGVALACFFRAMTVCFALLAFKLGTIARSTQNRQVVFEQSLSHACVTPSHESPKMWGPSIVGYGSYRYIYESGRTGEAPLAGFAIRGRELVIYVLAEGEEQNLLLSRLGKHKMGKVCLYFKRLSDLDYSVLEKLVTNSVAEVKRRYG